MVKAAIGCLAVVAAGSLVALASWLGAPVLLAAYTQAGPGSYGNGAWLIALVSALVVTPTCILAVGSGAVLERVGLSAMLAFAHLAGLFFAVFFARLVAFFMGGAFPPDWVSATGILCSTVICMAVVAPNDQLQTDKPRLLLACAVAGLIPAAMGLFQYRSELRSCFPSDVAYSQDWSFNLTTDNTEYYVVPGPRTLGKQVATCLELDAAALTGPRPPGPAGIHTPRSFWLATPPVGLWETRVDWCTVRVEQHLDQIQVMRSCTDLSGEPG